jgi:hypothetical protein
MWGEVLPLYRYQVQWIGLLSIQVPSTGERSGLTTGTRYRGEVWPLYRYQIQGEVWPPPGTGIVQDIEMWPLYRYMGRYGLSTKLGTGVIAGRWLMYVL